MFERFFINKFVDKVFASVAVSPFLYLFYIYIQQQPAPIENIFIIIDIALITFTMLLRRPPTRVISNPLFWILTFVATYWNFIFFKLYQTGERIAPMEISLTIVILGMLLTFWARWSLGRNIGFVPAQREIVTTGPYNFIRHPIYTGWFMIVIASTLSNFSRLNLLLNSVWIFIWMIKSIIEENFLLSGSTEYQQYTQRVTKRWFPFLF